MTPGPTRSTRHRLAPASSRRPASTTTPWSSRPLPPSPAFESLEGPRARRFPRGAWSRLCGLLLVLALAAEASARPQCELVDLVPSPSNADLAFGGSLSASQGRFAVGAPGDGDTPGSVSIYTLQASNAFLEARLQDASATSGAEFGAAVALVDDLLFVGAPDEGLSGVLTGLVYVYRFDGTTWSQTQVLEPSTLTAFGEFGRALDTDGERLLVGARFDSALELLVGAAYVFEDQGGLWTETARLDPPVVQEELEFGSAVAIDGNWAACGAPGDDFDGLEAGAAYVFQLQAGVWTGTQRLTGSDTDDGDRFGEALDLQGDVMMIGSPLEETSAAEDDAGGVYCFDRAGTTWSQCQLLFEAGGGTGDRFGHALALAADQQRLVIGAPGSETFGSSAGVAHQFELSGTVFVQSGELVPQDHRIGSATGEQLGSAVAVDDDLALVASAFGDPLDLAASAGSAGRGSAAAYSLDGSTCASLGSDRVDLSLSAGGTQTLALDAGPGFAGDLYVVAGTLGPRDPGFFTLGSRIPLTVDAYFLQTLTAPSPPLVGSFGTLDALGQASTEVTLPALSDPTLAGTVVHHAFVALDGGLVHVSRPVGLHLQL